MRIFHDSSKKFSLKNINRPRVLVSCFDLSMGFLEYFLKVVYIYAGADPGFFKRGSIIGLQAKKGGPGGGPILGPMLKSPQRGPKRGARTSPGSVRATWSVKPLCF